MKNVATIVSADATESIEGIKKLAKAIHGEFAAQRKSQDVADAHGLEIGRLICEFASRGDVQAQISVINKNKNGRPQAAHCYIAEQLFISGEISGLSQRHMERCARAFLKAKVKGLSLTQSIRAIEASDIIGRTVDKNPNDSQPSPERLFNTEPSEETESPDFDPERDALKIARKIKEFLYTPEGHPRLRSQKQKLDFAKCVDKALHEMGIDWELVPQERK